MIKKLICVVSMTAFLSLGLAAQDGDEESEKNDQTGMSAYNKGDINLNAGISLGTYGYGYVGSRSFTVPITLALEYGFHEYISGGAMVGYARWKYDYSYVSSPYTYSWSYLSFAPRASFHYLPLLNEHLDLGVDETKFDFYLTLFAAFEIHTYQSSDPYMNDYYDNTSDFSVGSFLGFKYMLSKNIGLFFEAGRHAFGYGTVGVNIRL
jgi:hypothetical protein